MAVDGSEPEKVFERTAHPWDWSSDGKEILFLSRHEDPAPFGVAVLNVTSGEKTTILQHPEHALYQAHFDPHARWITFIAVSHTGPPRSQVFIAPYRGYARVEHKEWIQVTDGWGSDDKPRWSPDGNLLYFTSYRDGFRCIWAQRLDPETKHPVGDALEVYPFHTASLSMLNVNLGVLEISVARDRMVWCLEERKGNIWMAELTEK